MSPTSREESDIGFGRIVAFSDGVFAVAITLLVLSIDEERLDDVRDADGLVDRLGDLSGQVSTYFIAFAVVGLFWIGHHRFFEELRAFDTGLMGLNLAYLALIAFIPFPTEVFSTHDELAPAVVFFAGSMALVGIVDAAMFAYAWRRGMLTARTEKAGRRVLLLNLYLPAVFLLSIPVALVDPDLAPYTWFLTFLAVGGQRLTRRLRSEG